MLASGIDAIWK